MLKKTNDDTAVIVMLVLSIIGAYPFCETFMAGVVGTTLAFAFLSMVYVFCTNRHDLLTYWDLPVEKQESYSLSRFIAVAAGTVGFAVSFLVLLPSLVYMDFRGYDQLPWFLIANLVGGFVAYGVLIFDKTRAQSN
ncbi:MAG: hypothetical protein VXY83_03235 [Pseudomonadota bacterium]|nr:hypothetical protein [Pseudomonadota bacterium]